MSDKTVRRLLLRSIGLRHTRSSQSIDQAHELFVIGIGEHSLGVTGPVFRSVGLDGRDLIGGRLSIAHLPQCPGKLNPRGNEALCPCEHRPELRNCCIVWLRGTASSPLDSC